MEKSNELNGMTEAELVEEVLQGRTEAYSEIFLRHRERAFALALQYVRNYEDAKDVVQDAFVKAYQSLARFDRRRKLAPWLMTIVRNMAIDLLRRHKRAGVQEIPEMLADPRTPRAESSVLHGEVLRALASLSEEHREIIFLKDYQGHKYVEIAEILSIPLGTVMSRLHHARRNLMALLKESYRP